MSNKYLPGQRLDTAADALRALADGQKICETINADEGYLHLVDGKLEWDDGVSTSVSVNSLGQGWCTYTPPKRKVVSTRWFAVRTSSLTADGMGWAMFGSEADAKECYPNALAYIKAECEVLVDDDAGGGGG